MRLYEIFYFDEIDDKHAYVFTEKEVPKIKIRTFLFDVFGYNILKGNEKPIFIKSVNEALGIGKCFIRYKGFVKKKKVKSLEKELSKNNLKNLSDKY